MRLVTTMLVALSLVTSTLGAGLLHVHDAFQHPHEDHHHGVAAHAHVRVQIPDDDLRFEPCDPATHLRILSFTCVDASTGQVLFAPERSQTVSDGQHFASPVRPPQDVRAHGPPRTAAPSRAPPYAPAV